MTTEAFFPDLDPALSQALEKKGYTELTAVQKAVLDPALAERDLRITSQTGSGKTVAIGFAIHNLLSSGEPEAGPRALVVTPTRELAKQVEAELSWLYAASGLRVVSVTGGAGYRDERRALSSRPAVVVGTPGRMLDHLKRGGIDATSVAVIVLDEADRLLDLGFREDLEAIFGFTPEGRRSHLVSATFPREVRALADATQSNPIHVEGTRLGAANVDIEHVVHLVDPRERMSAIINLLLAYPDEQMLLFARTRADVATIARTLGECGFATSSLSGEMEQPARNKALAQFKRGALRVLVATDVAARGIDVHVSRVVHAEPPLDPDSYTHRSGRTGRAGRKGTSSILAAPPELARTTYLLKRAGVTFRFDAIPTADAIRAASDARMFATLTSHGAEEAPVEPSVLELAERIAAEGDPAIAIARLLARTKFQGPTEAREIRRIDPPSTRPLPKPDRATRHERRDESSDRSGWVRFRVSWGMERGADTRRLMAMACRRGNIRGSDIGRIIVERRYAVLEIAAPVATAFGEATREPDPKEPGIYISPEREEGRPNGPPPAKGGYPRKGGPRHDDRPRHDDGPRHDRKDAKPRHEDGPREESAARHDDGPRHEHKPPRESAPRREDGPRHEGAPHKREPRGEGKPHHENAPRREDGPRPFGGPYKGGPHKGGPHKAGPHKDAPHKDGPDKGGPFKRGPHKGGPFKSGPHKGGPHKGGKGPLKRRHGPKE